MLEAYVEGELDEGAQARVASHLSACGGCADLHCQMERELKLFSLYLLDINPPPTAWDELRGKIGRERTTAHASTTAAARPAFFAGLRRAFALPRFASAFTLLLIAAGVTAYVLSRAGGGANVISEKDTARLAPTVTVADKLASPEKEKTTGAQPATGTDVRSRDTMVEAGPGVRRQDGSRRVLSKGMPARAAASRSDAERINPRRRIVSASALTTDHLLHKAERQYQAAIAKLRRDAGRRHIEPEVFAQFEKSLVAVDRAIARTQRAVKDNPGDPVAAQYMIAAYSKKMDVLMEMTRQ